MYKTWQIRLHGKVQGVGFRPFVWKSAIARNLKGYVSNGMEGLEIKIVATKSQATNFLNFILKNAPVGSYIQAYTLDADEKQFFENFTIRESTSHETPSLLVGADVALCADCLTDLQDTSNRRFGYAFTTCTCCGPRYSILEKLPYDREHTTMKQFQMCRECEQEFENPNDRRFFSQTNSCPSCGISIQLLAADGTVLSTDANEIIKKSTTAWFSGKIVAIKGLSGYLLTCDATNEYAVELLRLRKHRPTKPFALMYPSMEVLRSDVLRSKREMEVLQSSVAPIVLLTLKNRPKSGIAYKAIAPELDKVGVMLPYAPLLFLLLEKFGRPIVATSGNISQSPIVFQEEAHLQLGSIADFLITHNREIAVPQDDSVLAFADEVTPIVLRARAVWLQHCCFQI
ncbi:MAG: carbamoyltransferase HypF [Saprospiraceae bacterium]|nr:carbamoyltransferase HypF [Saprospiraceae bacterium]